MIFPPIFYFYLKAAGRVREKKKLTAGASTFELEEDYPRVTFIQMVQNTGIPKLIVGLFIVTVGVMICIFSSISAVKDLLTTSFETPCYVGWFRPELLGNHTLPTYCCGWGYNISRSDLDLTCQLPHA
jgi:hypothetical protein